MNRIISVKPITAKLVSEAEELANKADALREGIEDRINYIVTSIFKTFDKQDAYWHFDGAGEGEVGYLWPFLFEDQIYIVIDNCPGESMIILLKDGSEWCLNDGFPTRWLYENFEEELAKGKGLWQKSEDQRKFRKKMKRQKTSEQTKNLAKSAAAKLSKAELSALKKTITLNQDYES